MITSPTRLDDIAYELYVNNNIFKRHDPLSSIHFRYSYYNKKEYKRNILYRY